MDVDYLIIGQGLAGSLLAWELIQRDKKVIVVDNNKENASLIAAGLINPVTGMRFVKSTDVDHYLPFALHYYQQLSLYFQQTFYVEKPMLRVIRNDKELIACQKRLIQAGYQDYLSKITPSFPLVNTSYGLLEQKQTGYLLTQPLLKRLKKYFISKNAYIKTDCLYDDIKLVPNLIWKHIRPKHIIFCEGYLAIQNPWFSWLPFQPVKGEIITASSPKKIIDSILNYGQWFIPLNSHQFRTGASFDRNISDTKTTSSSKSMLLKSLNQVYPDLILDHIINQQAGIRPTTLDKHPFIGSHPHYKNLVFFNGFGAKGSLQIPLSCQNLVDHLINNQPIILTNDISRYYEKT
ncbi:MAG: FAD-binding oxidoreductase [Methylococcales bacterium]|nr:FAD-binding oxidoreductase [Methylococcales bacterium]